MKEKHLEIGKTVYNFSVNEYLKLFQGKDCPFDLGRYYNYRGFKNIKHT